MGLVGATRFVRRFAALGLLVLGFGGCRGSGPGGSPREAARAAVLATVAPSALDAHLAMLPEPVQALVQLDPAAVLSDTALSLAGGAFAQSMSADSSSASACARALASSSRALTYAWIGGEGGGAILIVDGAFDTPAVRACLDAMGLDYADGDTVDPDVGGLRMLDQGASVIARVTATRRAVGTPRVVGMALERSAKTDPASLGASSDGPLWMRLRQGEIRAYADIDEMIAVGADFLPLQDEADQIGLVLRLEEWRARAVALARGRTPRKMAPIQEAFRTTLQNLRRSVLDDPRISATSAYHAFDEAVFEREGTVVRVEVSMDRAVLTALIRWFADRTLRRLAPPPAP